MHHKIEMTRFAFLAAFLLALPTALPAEPPAGSEFYFPPPGRGLDKQARRTPVETGLNPAVVEQLQGKATRWALWRNGYLVHVEGDFNKAQDVASLRKTWYAMAVGAAIKQGQIPSLDQKINLYETDLKGNDALATWRHLITQSAGFDYPHPSFPEIGDPKPGEVWTYSDWNLVRLCNALAKVYGKHDYHDDFPDVMKQAYFDAIGMQGWSTRTSFDRASGMEDGVRLVLNLEHMGRLGLLALARGTWNGVELVPRSFVEELETKQTCDMKLNCDGPYDGKRPELKNFREAPYGFLTWVNTDGDYYPGASRAWACGSGGVAGTVLWNHTNGIVYSGVGVRGMAFNGIPRIIEANIVGPNPAHEP